MLRTVDNLLATHSHSSLGFSLAYLSLCPCVSHFQSVCGCCACDCRRCLSPWYMVLELLLCVVNQSLTKPTTLKKVTTLTKATSPQPWQLTHRPLLPLSGLTRSRLGRFYSPQRYKSFNFISFHSKFASCCLLKVSSLSIFFALNDDDDDHDEIKVNNWGGGGR